MPFSKNGERPYPGAPKPGFWAPYFQTKTYPNPVLSSHLLTKAVSKLQVCRDIGSIETYNLL